jgi:O-antigen/teichoic acid export membrane protein
VYYIIKEIKNFQSQKLFDFSFLKKQLSYAMPLGISNSARVFAQQLDKLILLSYVSPAAYAIYSIASYGVPGLNQLYLSISQVYIPRMSSAFHDSNIQLVKDLYKSLVSKTLSYTIPVVLIIVVFAPVIVPFLFSDKYIDSVPYFQIYLFTFIFSAMGNGVVLRSTDQTKKSLYAYLYSLIFIIPLVYFAIKFYGLNGAIISAFISSVLPRFFLTRYDLAVLKISVFEIFPWRQIGKIFLISSVLLIPFFLLIQFFTVKILAAILCILIYLGSVFLIETICDVFLISKEELLKYIKRYSPINVSIH